MKRISIFLIFLVSLTLMLGCTKDFDKFSENPNDPQQVSTGFILTYAQKYLMDNMRDEWFGGRCTFLLSQYWAQNNYTDEDRYLFRTTVTDAQWRYFYLGLMNLRDIVRLNTDEETKNDALANGANENQIAVANILTAYIMQIVTDTWGDVPFTQALLGNENQTPVYDKQSSIYPALITMLKDAAAMIDLNKDGIKSGDIIYNGDMALWKKFANSLRLRIALRMKAKDPAPFNEVVALGPDALIASNDEIAAFKYVGVAPNNGPLYDAWFTENRNDFTMSKPFVDLLKGVNDTLNSKTNPFTGIFDPRLPIFCTPVNGEYLGMPYGMTDSDTKAYAANCPNFKNDPSVVQASDFSYVLMDYAEVCFILSEANGWDQTWYANGVEASLEWWGVAAGDIATYMAALPAANQERVLTQKYIALYPQGEQGWFEYRRTGFPHTLVHPGEITHVGTSGNIIFTPLEGNQIPRRLLYPIEEQGVNANSYAAAVAQMGGDTQDINVWWAQ
ncbi:MAG TPA: SusD/RagB family nutrient-binding outer membrane lipoprotein [Bacteroidales bacterium]|nr:SusD/RagB family nutrient-binding outer membrane lipoprotein [Bacteroidales bacterium]HSA42901.1 SusD/RagB family nutrient-binding outer membrane lipoprotein [Bacteroidales bacterium]